MAPQHPFVILSRGKPQKKDLTFIARRRARKTKSKIGHIRHPRRYKPEREQAIQVRQQITSKEGYKCHLWEITAKPQRPIDIKKTLRNPSILDTRNHLFPTGDGAPSPEVGRKEYSHKLTTGKSYRWMRRPKSTYLVWAYSGKSWCSTMNNRGLLAYYPPPNRSKSDKEREKGMSNTSSLVRPTGSWKGAIKSVVPTPSTEKLKGSESKDSGRYTAIKPGSGCTTPKGWHLGGPI